MKSTQFSAIRSLTILLAFNLVFAASVSAWQFSPPNQNQSTQNQTGSSQFGGNQSNGFTGGLPPSGSPLGNQRQSGGQQDGQGNFGGNNFGPSDQSFPRVASNPNLNRKNFPNNSAGTFPSQPANGARPDNSLNEGKEFKPGTVVANVGGYPIFRADVIADINQLIEANMPTAPEEFKNEQREKALPFAVERAIEQKLLFVDAVRTIPDQSKMPEVISSIRDQFAELRMPEMMKNLKVETPAEAEAKLRKLGTSLRQAREAWVNSQFAGFFVKDKINMKPEITHFEMLEYYNANRKEYFIPAAVRFEHIQVNFDKHASKEAAWQAIGQIGNEIVYGANFAAVAKKTSDGFNADKGGLNEWTTKGSIVHKKVDEAIFSLPVGSLSDRMESKVGFHIVRVLDRRNEGYIPFSESQDEIKAKIKKQKQDESLKKYIETLKKEIPVERYFEKPVR